MFSLEENQGKLMKRPGNLARTNLGQMEHKLKVGILNPKTSLIVFKCFYHVIVTFHRG